MKFPHLTPGRGYQTEASSAAKGVSVSARPL